MALNVKELSMDAQLALLEKLLPVKYFEPLAKQIKDGYIKVETKFYNLAFHYGSGQVIATNLPLSTPSLQSIAPDSPQLAATKKVMLALYGELAAEISALPSVDTKDVTDASVASLQAAKQALSKVELPLDKEIHAAMAQQASKLKAPSLSSIVGNFSEALGAPPPTSPGPQTFTVPPTPKTATKPKIKPGGPPVVRLREATQIGQQVRGTSPEAKYYVIARSDLVKVAMRNRYHTHGQISFRVEFSGVVGSTLINHMKNLGLGVGKNDEGAYMSMHVGTTNQNGDTVSLGKIVGSFLMGLGVEYDQMIINVNDIPEDK
jgi:hypothetical protein